MILTTIKEASANKFVSALFILMLAGCGGGTKQIRLNQVDEKNRLIEIIVDDLHVKDSEGGSSLVKKLEEKFALSFEKVSVRTGYRAENAENEEMVIVVPRSVFYQDMPDTQKGTFFNGSARVSSEIDILMDSNWKHYRETGYGNSEGGEVLAILTFPTVIVWGFLSEAMHKASAFNSAIENTAIGLHNQILSSSEFENYTAAVNTGRTTIVKSKTPPSKLIMTALFSDDNGNNPNNILDAGENAEIVVNVKNNGKGTAFESKLEVASDNPKIIMMDREIKVGDIEAGETKEIKVSLRAALDTGMGKASFKLALRESRGYDAEKVTIDVPTVNEKILPSDLTMSARFSDSNGHTPNSILDAGENAELVISVKNNGKGTGIETTLEVTSDNPKIMADREIKIGDIQAGETKEIKIKLGAGLDIETGKESFQLTLRERRGYDAKKVVMHVSTARLMRPQLEIITTEINDGEAGLAKGNGNGIPENGETIELTVFVKNRGEGKAIGVNLNGGKISSGIQWVRDSVHIGTIQPGAVEKAKVAFTVPRNFDASEIAANLKVSDMRGVNEVEKKAALSYVKRSPDIKYAWRTLFRGTQVDTLVNGEVYELDITFNNRGEIPAKDVSVSISSGGGIGLSDKSIHLGEIKAGESVSKRVTVSVPRTFEEKQALLNIAVSQSDFPSVKDTIQYAVDVKRPRLAYLANLQNRIGGNTLEQGESSVLEVQVLNEGNLSANGVKVTVKSGDENLKLVGPTDSLIGIISANSRSETIKIPVSTRRRIKTGDAFLDVNITQEDFPPVASQYAINVREEGAVVVDVESEERGRNRPVAKAQSGPAINLKGSPNELTTSGESYSLTFDAEDSRNIEKIIVAVNGIVILNESPGLKISEIRKDIPLKEGENRVAITAYNADNVSSREELVITRLAEEDVDVPPITGIKEPDAVAVVIGISRYENKDVPRVNYARRDAATVKEYLVRTLGFDEKRILDLYDEEATLSRLNSVFRTKLKNMIVPGKSDVFVFYSGHGVPDVNKKEPYLAPYGLDPADVENTGYVLKDLYEQLARIDAKSVTVAIDSCFSGSSEGGAIIKDISPVFLDVSNPMLKVKNGVIFTASSSTEVSSWYHKKQHGLFTYFFLNGLRGKADKDNDGQVTVQELGEYVKRNVTEQARQLNRVQTPEVTGGKDKVLLKYK